MKKKLGAGLLLMLLCVAMLSGCGSKEETRLGFVHMDGDVLYFDEVEWITSEDTERMKELGLSEDDMMDGYYIYNEKEEDEALRTNESTSYTFYDWNALFVEATDEESYSIEKMLYTTKSAEEFKQDLDAFGEIAAGIPFWVTTKGKYVLEVKEQYIP